MTEFIIKISIAFVLSFITFFVMMRIQKKKQERADYDFEFKMKCMGLSTTVTGEEDDQKVSKQ